MHRVHLPQDFGLATLTCGTTEGLADALRAELALRQWTDRELARRVRKSHSTLGNYLRGERCFPADLLTDVLRALREDGPFRLPGLSEVHVIPIRGDTDPDIIPGSPRVDTVTVLIDVPIEDQEGLAWWFTQGWRRATSQKARRRARGRWHQYQFSPAGIVAHHRVGKSPDGWLLVEFRAFEANELTAFETIKSFISPGAASAASRMRVARLDFAVDYPVHPTWLLLRRPGVRGYEHIVNRRGEYSVALGSRRSRWYLRCYDLAAKHGLPGPQTRIEVELKPERPWSASEVRVLGDNTFEHLYLGELTAPDLTDEEVVQLQLARAWGVKTRQKVPGATWPVLERAMEKAATAARLSPSRDISKVRTYLQEFLALLFIVR